MVLKLNLTCTLDIESFRSLQTYMVLKRSSKKDPRKRSFRSLQTYMVLKPAGKAILEELSFRSLQTYMVLKLITDSNVLVAVLDPYKLTWFSNLKFKNFTVLTELLHTDICCKPIFLIPRCIFYHLKLNQAILLIQYMIIFTVQPFFL